MNVYLPGLSDEYAALLWSVVIQSSSAPSSMNWYLTAPGLTRQMLRKSNMILFWVCISRIPSRIGKTS